MLRITSLIVISCVPVAVAAQSLPATVVARTGQDAAGLSGVTYTTLTVLPRLGANGHVAFSGGIAGSGVASSNNFAIWVGAPGSLQVAARKNTAESGPETFDGTFNAGVDSSGTASLWTQLAFPVPNNQNQVLYSYLPGGNGGNTTVAHEGITAAPGFTSGATWAAIGSGHASNDSGAVAFIGTAVGGDATSTTDQGLWAGTPGNLQLVAREGTTAPGATGTTPVFSTTATPILGKAINASGQVGFGASLSGSVLRRGWWFGWCVIKCGIGDRSTDVVTSIRPCSAF